MSIGNQDCLPLGFAKRALGVPTVLLVQQLELLDYIRQDTRTQTEILRRLSAKLEPVKTNDGHEVRSRLIDAALLARAMAESAVASSGPTAGQAAQLESILRDSLNLGFGVKLSDPKVFKRERMQVERVEPTSDPTQDLQIARILAPEVVQERGDGPDVLLKPASVVLFSFKSVSSEQENGHGR